MPITRCGCLPLPLLPAPPAATACNQLAGAVCRLHAVGAGGAGRRGRGRQPDGAATEVLEGATGGIAGRDERSPGPWKDGGEQPARGEHTAADGGGAARGIAASG